MMHHPSTMSSFNTVPNSIEEYTAQVEAENNTNFSTPNPMIEYENECRSSVVDEDDDDFDVNMDVDGAKRWCCPCTANAYEYKFGNVYKANWYKQSSSSQSKNAPITFPLWTNLESSNVCPVRP
jgi:hypothetical protein